MDAGDTAIMSELTYSALQSCEYSTYPYQDEAISKIRSWIYEDDHNAGILQMATGTGKTVTVGILIRQLIEESVISRALFAVHRTELVKQAIDTFELCGLMVGREQGSHHGFSLGDPHVVCTTIQSMAKRCKRYQPDDFQLIITDEVHHAGESNKTYSSVYDHFPDAKLVGVTATVDRPDGQSLKRFEKLLSYQEQLYKNGFIEQR